MGMVEDLPYVPPAFLLLVEGFSRCGSLQEMRSLFREMLPELRDQSEAFESANLDRDTNSRLSQRFEIHLHGALDLLSGEGCQSLDCRIAAANRIARSVGLIADRVWLTDTFTDRLIEFGRITNRKIDTVIADVCVIARLLPLIRSGIVKFRSPWLSTCSSCTKQFEVEIEAASGHIAKLFRRDFRIEQTGEYGYSAYTGRCFEPPVIYRSGQKEVVIPSARDFGTEIVSRQLRSTFWIAREAALTGGSVFSNSRVGLAGLLHSEGRLVDRKTLLLLDKEREFSLPWVTDLSAQQIVELRHEAAKALPALREKMARSMALSNATDMSSSSPSSLIAELREQAEDVRAELEAKRKGAARYWKVTYGLLGLGCSAYGVAADQIVPGIGGLLSVVHLLVSHKAGYETDVSKLEAKPGYVLLKAQDILSHTH